MKDLLLKQGMALRTGRVETEKDADQFEFFRLSDIS